jgi:hypothetical protein
MTCFDLRLSSAAMKNIVIDTIQENFEFVVGGEGYKCARVMADFLSPRVSLSHSVDSSIAEYIVQIPDSNDRFKMFLSLGSGSTIPVTKVSLEFFLSLSREFGNSHLYSSLLEHFDNDFIRSQLHDSTNLSLFHDDLIGRISSKFYDLIASLLDVIPVSVLFHILSHNLLMITSEDSLFSYISSHLCSDPEYSNLLQFVRFEYLSVDSFSSFLSSLPDWIDHRLWESISLRLIVGAGLKFPPTSQKEVEFPLQEPKSVDGIISYLTRKHGGNVHEKGIVTITSKSLEAGALRNAADLTSGSWFASKEGPNQWICWDFHQLRLRPTHYTISSAHLKSWVIESSLYGSAWTEIDRKSNTNDLKASSTASFALAKPTECRFIRLTQTGRDHSGNNSLRISAVEVFGTLLESDDSWDDFEVDVDDIEVDVDNIEVYVDEFQAEEDEYEFFVTD